MKKILQHPSFRPILREWALHLDACGKPEGFAHWFEEMMVLPEPPKKYPQMREKCWAFARSMVDLPWESVQKALPRRGLRAYWNRSFRSKEAEPFYKGFRHRVLDEVNDYVKGLKKADRSSNLTWQARTALAYFGDVFPLKRQEKQAKKEGVLMPEPGYQRELVESHVQVALMVWAERQDMRCRDCGKVCFAPTQLRRVGNGPAWTVESWSSPIEDGWLHLEEHIPEANGYRISIKLLCVECRDKRSL